MHRPFGHGEGDGQRLFQRPVLGGGIRMFR